MATSIEQAACNALALYLGTQIVTTPGTTIRAYWPDGGAELAELGITIVRAGDSEEELWGQPIARSSTLVGSTQVTTVYEVASITQRLQLDIWAKYDPARDDLVQQVRSALRKGPATTLGLANGDTLRHGVLLALGDGWTGNVDIYFDRFEHLNTPDSIQRSEYRASAMGRAQMTLTETATEPRMAKLSFEARASRLNAATTVNEIMTMQRIAGNLVITHTTAP